MGPPFHRPIFPSLPLRRLSPLLAPLLAPSHTFPPSFVSRLFFFLPLSLPRLIVFCFFCCFVVCLAVRNSLWGRGRFALAVKSGRGLSSAGQHGPYQIALSLLRDRRLFREEKTAKVPNVCIPQLPVTFVRRNACYSRAKGGGAAIWRPGRRQRN